MSERCLTYDRGTLTDHCTHANDLQRTCAQPDLDAWGTNTQSEVVQVVVAWQRQCSYPNQQLLEQPLHAKLKPLIVDAGCAARSRKQEEAALRPRICCDIRDTLTAGAEDNPRSKKAAGWR